MVYRYAAEHVELSAMGFRLANHLPWSSKDLRLSCFLYRAGAQQTPSPVIVAERHQSLITKW